MKHNSFPSKEELLLQCNTIKQRQERIIQVRQQSKQMSAAILEKVKREAQKQSEEIENHILSEIRNYHQKELEHSRKQYEKCISEINHLHYLQQVNVNSKGSRISNKKKLRNLSSKKSEAIINDDRKVGKQLGEKLIIESHEQQSSLTKSPNEKLNDKKGKVASRQQNTGNIVIDSEDDQVKKCAMMNFRKHSPKVKHLKSLQSENENGNRSKCLGKSYNQSGYKFEFVHPTKDDRVITNEEYNKTQIDEMYNHLVHDRIRVLEQKDKILDRRTMFLPNGANMAKNPPRFSEYFVRFHSAKIPSTKIVTTVQSNTSRNDSTINEVLKDVKQNEMKNKSLTSERGAESNDVLHSKTVSLLEKKQNQRKQDSLRNYEKPAAKNSNPNKNPFSSNSSDSSSMKTTRQKVLCSSHTSKKTLDSSHESDEKEKLPSKRRLCKKKLRSKNIQVTLSNCRKSVIVDSSDNVVNTQQNNTSSSSSTHKDFHQNTTAPVKLVVEVLPSNDCTIEIKSNTADKRYMSNTVKRNVEKVKDWRTLFKNQEKLTESSYFSPPEYDTKILANSEKFNDQEVLPNLTKNIGYYVRKLLLMSPESVDDLDVSSCDTTLIKDSSRNISIDSNLRNKQYSSSQRSSQHNQFADAENHVDDSENVRKLLLKCLRLATAEADDINLTSFKSVNSSCNNKVLDHSPTVPELNDSNISRKNFINAAFQRLLPLYQNSLDDNLDCTTQSQLMLNHIDHIGDQSEVDESKDDSAFISPSAYLQKFVSSLSSTSEKPDKNCDIMDYLKKYIELQPSFDKSNKIAKDSFDCAGNVVSKDESCISLPSVEGLTWEGPISKTNATSETQNESQEFLDEEEFVKRILQTDFISKESNLEDDSGQSESNIKRKCEQDEKYTNDIITELRSLGLNWMDTTLQRTLQASVINSTSSAEDSAGPLRNVSKLSSRPSISFSLANPPQQPKLQLREFPRNSSTEIHDLQSSLP